jgi:8-oxo-dGTP pyrophosphatase MutT (NUDIX family)
VEPGESPRVACIRELDEELGLPLPVGGLLVVDWAPAEGEGDKLLFVFDGGHLTGEQRERISLRAGELSEWRFVADEQLDDYVPDRLSRRLRTAVGARASSRPIYAEHGKPAT